MKKNLCTSSELTNFITPKSRSSQKVYLGTELSDKKHVFFMKKELDKANQRKRYFSHKGDKMINSINDKNLESALISSGLIEFKKKYFKQKNNTNLITFHKGYVIQKSPVKFNSNQLCKSEKRTKTQYTKDENFINISANNKKSCFKNLSADNIAIKENENENKKKLTTKKKKNITFNLYAKKWKFSTENSNQVIVNSPIELSTNEDFNERNSLKSKASTDKNANDNSSTSSNSKKIFSSNKIKALYLLSKSNITPIKIKLKIFILTKELNETLSKEKIIETSIDSIVSKINKLDTNLSTFNYEKIDEINSIIDFPSPLAIMSLFFLTRENEIKLYNKELDENRSFYDLLWLLIDNDNIPNYEENYDENWYDCFFETYSVSNIKELFINVIFPKVFRNNENECEQIFDYYSPHIMELICDLINIILKGFQRKFFWADIPLRQILRKFEYYLEFKDIKNEIKDISIYKKYNYLVNLNYKLEKIFKYNNEENKYD